MRFTKVEGADIDFADVVGASLVHKIEGSIYQVDVLMEFTHLKISAATEAKANQYRTTALSRSDDTMTSGGYTFRKSYISGLGQ